METVVIILAIIVMIAITVVDFRKMEIPNTLILALVPLAVILAVIDGRSITHRIIGLFIISVPMLILALLIDSSFGGGDIKLIAVCGFMLDYSRTLVAMFIAILLGGIVAAVLILSKKKDKSAQIPFGPYICVGVTTALLFGDRIVTWYLSLFGL